MATNPMQRKARNSFLLGMLLMLVISGAVIAILFMQLMNFQKKEKENASATVNAYVLNQDVSSGQVITTDMLSLQPVNRTLVPNNATSDISIIENYSLQDKEGNNIGTIYDKSGNVFLYLRKNDKNYLIEQETATDNYYIQKNNNNYVCVNKKDDGSVVFSMENNNSELKRNADGSFNEANLEKEYLELNSVPLVAKITMNKNTLITTELLSKSDNMVQDDRRKQEYNMLILPTDLTTGDYIDIRLMMPSGQDFIVVAKKEVELPTISGGESADTIWINLTEDEILHMSCAIVDAFQKNGAKLYATKYTEAGMQKAAIPTYPLNESTLDILQNDPNVLEKAMNEIRNRYNTTDMTKLRKNINSIIENEGEKANSNLETNMQESVTKSKNSRKEYLDSLAGVVE